MVHSDDIVYKAIVLKKKLIKFGLYNKINEIFFQNNNYSKTFISRDVVSSACFNC